MSKRDFQMSGGLDKIVERQIRNWEIARAQKLEAGSSDTPGVYQFVTIANMCAAGGSDVARLLAEELNWPLFDRLLLTAMAGDDQVRALIYQTMDERDLGWVETVFHGLMQDEFRKNDYFYRLTETVLCLASRGHGVYVGRSADLILPKDKGLRCKVVASRERCAQNFARKKNCSLEKARNEIDRIEKERQEFTRNHFRIDGHDPVRFDMIINLERFTIRQAVNIITSAMKMREVN
ncbi:MAG: cytidylate kinase-like family protein [Planctomycetota bacterium]|jgi:cytidylate kinase